MSFSEGIVKSRDTQQENKDLFGTRLNLEHFVHLGKCCRGIFTQEAGFHPAEVQ